MDQQSSQSLKLSVIWAAKVPSADQHHALEKAGIGWRQETDDRYFLRLVITENPNATVVIDTTSSLSAAELRHQYPNLNIVYLYEVGDSLENLLSIADCVPNSNVKALLESVASLRPAQTSDCSKIERVLTAARNRDLPANKRLASILAYGVERFGAEAGIVSDIKNTKYKVVAARAAAGSVPIEPGAAFDLGTTYCTITVSERNVVAINHFKHSEYNGHPCYSKFLLESYIAAPLWFANKVIGTLNFSSAKPRAAYSLEDISVITRLANTVENILAEEYAANIGMFDSITGLTSRIQGETDLKNLYEGGSEYHLLFIDLDRFKSINDELGHKVGDQVLNEMARRLRSVVREGDQLMRWGGDEFVVICMSEKVAVARKLADRIQTVASAPVVVGSQTFKLGASVGIAAHSDGSHWRDAVEAADLRMYKNKKMRRFSESAQLVG